MSTKAFENLGVSNKRRAYDSVDPLFDDEIPDVIKDNSKDFISTFAPVFERNARWSMKKSMPKFGNDDSTRDEVDKFYKFIQGNRAGFILQSRNTGSVL